MDSYKIYQIYYDDNQVLDDGFIPYKNDANEFLENQVILDKISTEKEYFGIVSHKFKSKTNFDSRMIEKIPPDYDVVTFFRSLKNKEYYLQKMDKWHPGSLRALQMIFEELDFSMDYVTVNHNGKQKIPTREIIYQNHFIARSEVYKRYVEEMLRPCVDLMKSATGILNELLWKDSKYSYANRVSEEVKKKVFGVNYYPLHPFICERLPSIWLTMNKDITVNQYFKKI